MNTPQELQLLAGLALAAADKAYAPYSHFRVGAAILTPTGEIFHGCNVENASYGLTICAERNAVFNMVAAGIREIETVVIYTPTSLPSMSCGGCRQVINEFGPRARVYCFCNGEDVFDVRMNELLPFAFGPHNLT